MTQALIQYLVDNLDTLKSLSVIVGTFLGIALNIINNWVSVRKNLQNHNERNEYFDQLVNRLDDREDAVMDALQEKVKVQSDVLKLQVENEALHKELEKYKGANTKTTKTPNPPDGPDASVV